MDSSGSEYGTAAGSCGHGMNHQDPRKSYQRTDGPLCSQETHPCALVVSLHLRSIPFLSTAGS